MITNPPLARNGNACGFSKAESSNRRRGGLKFNWRTHGGTIASLMLRFLLSCTSYAVEEVAG